MRVALYARISTNDERQHLQNQYDAMNRFVLSNPAPGEKWTVAQTYEDRESGAKDARPGLQKLMNDAAKKKFSAVIVFSLSRLTRGGPAKAFTYLERLNSYGVQFYSVTEPLFSTSSRCGELFIAIAAHIASEERLMIQERVRAGLARARTQGKQLGRPRVSVDPAKVLKLIAAGLSHRKMAKELKISPASAQRLIKKYEKP